MRKLIGIWLLFELLLAWMVSHWLGVGVLLLSWLAALVAGVYLLRGLGAQISQLRQGGAGLALAGPFARVGAAILFIIPGTLSDILALLILFPGTQSQVARRWSGFSTARQTGPDSAGSIIEGEFVEEIDKNRRIGP